MQGWCTGLACGSRRAQDAEELTQDYFVELARRAAMIRSSVGGWLHSLATSRSLNAVRSRNRRREHEQCSVVAKVQTDPGAEVPWSHVEPLLDKAIDSLPDELRVTIILHFLEGYSQSDVASQLGVHQSTVSRRIQEALEALRACLHESGFVMAIAPLASLMTARLDHTAAPHLLVSLTKIALAGVGSTAVGKSIGSVGIGLAKLTTLGKTLGTLVSPFIVQLVLGGWWGFVWATAAFGYLAWRQPKWLDKLNVVMGGKGAGYDFFPLARWTWTTPPTGWRKAIFQSLMKSVMMNGVAIAFLIQHGNPMSLGCGALMMGYAALPMVTAIRIWLRVRACPADAREQAAVSFPSHWRTWG